MVRTRTAPAPAPAGYLDCIISGPPAELNQALDELEFIDSYVGSTRRLVTASGEVAVKVRFRDDGRSQPMLPSADSRLPAVREHDPVERYAVKGRESPLRAQAVIERPAASAVAYRTVNVPWWQDRRKLVPAGLAAGAALGVVVLLVRALASALQAGAQAAQTGAQTVAQHAGAIVGSLFCLALVGLGALLLLRSGGSGCSGLHCSGCSKH